MSSTSTQRMARMRARNAGLPDPHAPQPCQGQGCTTLVRWGSFGAADGLCSVCWRQTPAGRDNNRERLASWRRRRDVAAMQAWTGGNQ